MAATRPLYLHHHYHQTPFLFTTTHIHPLAMRATARPSTPFFPITLPLGFLGYKVWHQTSPSTPSLPSTILHPSSMRAATRPLPATTTHPYYPLTILIAWSLMIVQSWHCSWHLHECTILVQIKCMISARSDAYLWTLYTACISRSSRLTSNYPRVFRIFTLQFKNLLDFDQTTIKG